MREEGGKDGLFYCNEYIWRSANECWHCPQPIVPLTTLAESIVHNRITGFRLVKNCHLGVYLISLAVIPVEELVRKWLIESRHGRYLDRQPAPSLMYLAPSGAAF